MSTFESILPNYATKLERDLEQVAAFAELPIEELANALDPWKIDIRFLPWLAFRFAVDFWNDDWSEFQKRDVVARQFNLQRLKGTEAGISGMLEVVDSSLREVIHYPRRAFASAIISKQQRDAWLERMPQIRIYFANYHGKADLATFPGLDGRKRSSFACHAFARLDAGAAIYGRRAVIRYPDGREVPMRRSNPEVSAETGQTFELDRVHVSGEAGPAIFIRRFAGHGYVTRKNKPAEIVTYSLDRTYDTDKTDLHLDTVAAGLDPVDVRYQRFSERVPRKRNAVFAGDFAGKHFVMADDGANHIFDRIFLHDKSVDVPWIKAHSFAGHARLGIAPFHAELLVEARSSKRPRAGYSGYTYLGRGFATKENLSKSKLAYAAVRRSKAGRDRIKVDTQTTRVRTFGETFKFGDDVKFGSRVQNRLK